MTPFHCACKAGCEKIVELMIDNSRDYKFDLEAKDNDGKTGFQLAEDFKKLCVVDLIKRKLPIIAL